MTNNTTEQNDNELHPAGDALSNAIWVAAWYAVKLAYHRLEPESQNLIKSIRYRVKMKPCYF
jgi:hypothetical protein